MRKYSFAAILFFGIIFLIGCGGGGGGSNGGGNNNGQNGTDTIPSDGFKATESNFIEGGQKHFAFGQTSTFGTQKEVVEWQASSGTINSQGKFFTPLSLDDTNATATITLTTANTIPTVSTRSITISPFPEYLTSKNLFSYAKDSQNYSVTFTDDQHYLAVGVFKNNTTTASAESITIQSSTYQASKLSKEGEELQARMQKLEESNPRYKRSKRENHFAPRQFSEKKSNKGATSKNRSADPIGFRDQFFHDENGPAVRNFEKQYSGTKCMVYSEINTATDTPYVTKERGAAIGHVFDQTNPYHPTGRSIFDVVTEYFGNPWGIDESGNLINGGGRDGEAPVILLLYNGGNNYGYFYWVDEEEAGKTFNGYTSNGAEIIYINQKYINDDIAVYSTLAHEFQHLCDYNQKFILNGNYNQTIYKDEFDEDKTTMFNEGQSAFSEELNGFSMTMDNGFGNDFIFNNVDIYLKGLSQPFSKGFYSWNGGSDYGKGYLFWHFIYESYGADVFKAITHSSKIQPLNVENVLGKKMNVVLQEFILSLLQLDTNKPIAAKYKITSIDFKKEYFDTKGKSLGHFSGLGYLNSFTNDQISLSEPYQIKLYKLAPINRTVAFSLKNILTESSYSIQTAIINK